MKHENLFFYFVIVLSVVIIGGVIFAGVTEAAPWPGVVLLVAAYAAIAWLCLRVTRR